MISGSFRLLSDEELKKRRDNQEKELKSILLEEYENFKKYIDFYELPEIKEIKVNYMDKIDASVRPNLSRVELKINEKFLGNKLPEYLKIVLFHEFTHIWDAVMQYGLRASCLTEYHAVQIAFARNIGQKNGLYWNKFSEKQMVWNNDKYITAAEYVKELSEHYSYMMEYNYYNESEERTHKFMYDLCQWIGYSVIFQKFCIEWEEKRKIEVFIPNELIDEIEQLYIGLRDNHDINEIEKNYIKIQVKFEQLNKLQICGDENYFLSDRQTGIDDVESLKKRCMAIENVYTELKLKHTEKYVFSRPYLNRSFVFKYFKKMYQDMMKQINNPILLKVYIQHYILRCPSSQEELLRTVEKIKPFFETIRYFEVVINRIKELSSVEIKVDERGREYYCTEKIKQFVEEIGFTPAFLAALLKGIADAGYLVEFSEDKMIIRQG